MRTKSAKQLVMTPLYRQRVVKAKKGKSSYSRKQKPRYDLRGFCFQGQTAFVLLLNPAGEDVACYAKSAYASPATMAYLTTSAASLLDPFQGSAV